MDHLACSAFDVLVVFQVVPGSACILEVVAVHMTHIDLVATYLLLFVVQSSFAFVVLVLGLFEGPIVFGTEDIHVSSAASLEVSVTFGTDVDARPLQQVVSNGHNVLYEERPVHLEHPSLDSIYLEVPRSKISNYPVPEYNSKAGNVKP